MHACMHAKTSMHASMQASMDTSMHAFMHACIHAWTHLWRTPDVRMMLREMFAKIAVSFFHVPFWYHFWVPPCAARSKDHKGWFTTASRREIKCVLSTRSVKVKLSFVSTIFCYIYFPSCVLNLGAARVSRFSVFWWSPCSWSRKESEIFEMKGSVS